MSILMTMGTTAIFAVLGLVGWISFKKISTKKSKTSPEPQKQKGDDKKDKEQSQSTTNLIKVIIWRPMGGGLLGQVGEPIICEERKDNNNNQLVINDEKGFKEDFNFNKDRIFETLEFKLNLQNQKTKVERSVILTTAITTQTTLCNEISSDVNKNKQYNALDERLKLRQLKVLKESLQMETVGNYMKLGNGGIRQFEFVAIDGVLYPQFFGTKFYRVYPDLLIKKKIFNQENTIFRNEVGSLQKDILNWMTIITIAIGLIMMGVGGWMMKHAYGKNSEMTLIANQGALSCTNTLASINANYGVIIGDYQRLKKSEQNTNDIKQEIPNTNIGGISIDPSKIINR